MERVDVAKEAQRGAVRLAPAREWRACRGGRAQGWERARDATYLAGKPPVEDSRVQLSGEKVVDLFAHGSIEVLDHPLRPSCPLSLGLELVGQLAQHAAIARKVHRPRP